jgi:hypothetical protein
VAVRHPRLSIAELSVSLGKIAYPGSVVLQVCTDENPVAPKVQAAIIKIVGPTHISVPKERRALLLGDRQFRLPIFSRPP